MSERPLPLACVFSVAGETLTHAEKSLFTAAQPFGFILFGRNIRDAEQVKKLTDSLRKAVGWECPIFIDQEGGRVARMKPPAWPAFSAAKYYGDKMAVCAEHSLCADMAQMADMLRAVGIDTNCAPVLDVLTEKTHQVIGDRAYSDNPKIVAQAATETCRVFLEHGVRPIIKHIPGHGRGEVDSHHDLPVVNATLEELRKTDFVPFQQAVNSPYAAGLWGMVAHIIYTAIDPVLPATLSQIVINNIVRNEIGFDGLLFSDDLDMKALEKYGTIPERANLSLQAGCDIALYCWADLGVMERLAANLPPLSAKGWTRWENSLNFRLPSA